MREILFRGKSRGTNKWVFGDFVTDACGISHEEYLNEYGDIGHIMTYVIPETVGQYTGLTDKKGKKIFEGDILESEFTKMPYLVCFGEYTYSDEYGDGQDVCGWYNEDECGCVTALGCSNDWATVIGNIHDNPELMGGDNE